MTVDKRNSVSAKGRVPLFINVMYKSWKLVRSCTINYFDIKRKIICFFLQKTEMITSALLGKTSAWKMY